MWILVVAAFRELTNEGRTRLQTLAYVGIPIAVLVIVWSFVSESRANRRAAEVEAELATPVEVRAGSYPVPVLTGAPTMDVEPVSVSATGPPEVLDG